jgi:hypothetical protein
LHDLLVDYDVVAAEAHGQLLSSAKTSHSPLHFFIEEGAGTLIK